MKQQTESRVCGRVWRRLLAGALAALTLCTAVPMYAEEPADAALSPSQAAEGAGSAPAQENAPASSSPEQAQSSAPEEDKAAPAEEASAPAAPAEGGEKPVFDPEAPNQNPVEAGPAVAPKDESGKFDPTKIAEASDFGDWEEQGCKG